MQVTEIMSSPVLCTPTTSARKAAHLMQQFNVGNLLIVEDMTSRKLIGVITDRDLVLRILVDRDPDKTTLQDCMTHSNLLCCKESDDVEQVLEAMAKRHLKRVPVLSEGNRVDGVLTDVGVLQYAEIKPIEVCRAMGRIVASQARRPNSLDAPTSYP